MKTYFLLFILCSFKLYSQATYTSNVTTYPNGLNETMLREITIDEGVISIRSYGKLATHLQQWEVIETEKLISDKSHEVIYKCMSLDKKFPTVIMVMYEGDYSEPSKIIVIQPGDNDSDEETIFWLDEN